MAPKNLLSPSALFQDTVEFRDKLAKYIKKYKHLHDTSRLEAALERIDRDIAKTRMEDNPEQWAYYGASRDEFNSIVANGLRTIYDPNNGRGVLYTRNPRIAWRHMTEGSQLLRFPFPMGGQAIKAANGQYDYFVDKPIHRKYLQVFLDGDLDDPSSWIEIGALR